MIQLELSKNLIYDHKGWACTPDWVLAGPDLCTAAKVYLSTYIACML